MSQRDRVKEKERKRNQYRKGELNRMKERWKKCRQKETEKESGTRRKRERQKESKKIEKERKRKRDRLIEIKIGKQ